MGLSERERHEITERLAALEAKAHSHPPKAHDVHPQPVAQDDENMLARLARLRAEANVVLRRDWSG